MNVRIPDLPSSERPRERLVRLGPGSLSDQELLALVLRTGGREANAVTIGQNLLSEWGSLEQMSAAGYEDLLRQSDLGSAKAAGLMAAFEIGRRSALGGRSPTTIREPEDLHRLVSPLLVASTQEEVVLVVTNSANRVLRTITPSAEDLAVTRRIQIAASAVGLRFLDHIVVAGNDWARCATGPA
jgi:DNA repair protein RadC